MVFIINAIKIIFILGFLVLIHETGHFVVARLCKVTVKEFAIGFGPTIWRKQGKETKYALRLIPLGGFVSMEGEEEHSDKEGSFSKSSIPKRIAIVVAGGLVNIIFALITYVILITVMTGDISKAMEATGKFAFSIIETIIFLNKIQLSFSSSYPQGSPFGLCPVKQIFKKISFFYFLFS